MRSREIRWRYLPRRRCLYRKRSARVRSRGVGLALGLRAYPSRALGHVSWAREPFEARRTVRHLHRESRSLLLQKCRLPEVWFQYYAHRPRIRRSANRLDRLSRRLFIPDRKLLFTHEGVRDGVY